MRLSGCVPSLKVLYLGLVPFIATYPVDSIYQSNTKRIRNIQPPVATSVIRLRWQFRETPEQVSVQCPPHKDRT